jgi:hypothetical protein
MRLGVGSHSLLSAILYGLLPAYSLSIAVEGPPPGAPVIPAVVSGPPNNAVVDIIPATVRPPPNNAVVDLIPATVLPPPIPPPPPHPQRPPPPSPSFSETNTTRFPYRGGKQPEIQRPGPPTPLDVSNNTRTQPPQPPYVPGDLPVPIGPSEVGNPPNPPVPGSKPITQKYFNSTAESPNISGENPNSKPITGTDRSNEQWQRPSSTSDKKPYSSTYGEFIHSFI